MTDKHLLDNEGRLFGKINIIDLMLGAILLFGVLGIMLVQSGYHVTSGQVVEGESDILITVTVSNLKTLDKNLFVPGETTAITIRNQPRGDVHIEDVQTQPVSMTMLDHNDQAILIPDLRENDSFDYTLKLKDHAIVTKDGYVTNGVKVKVGLPIELEGFKYRVNGRIIDVQPIQQG